MCACDCCSPMRTGQAHEHGFPGHQNPCCAPQEHHGSWAMPGTCHPHVHRRFWTKEEKIAALERYLEALRHEAQAVEEKLKRLRED